MPMISKGWNLDACCNRRTRPKHDARNKKVHEEEDGHLETRRAKHCELKERLPGHCERELETRVRADAAPLSSAAAFSLSACRTRLVKLKVAIAGRNVEMLAQ